MQHDHYCECNIIINVYVIIIVYSIQLLLCMQSYQYCVYNMIIIAYAK